MKKTGFRFDKTKAEKRFGELLKSIDPINFKPELDEFVRRSLKTASQETPTRDIGLIRRNQTEQYKYRTRYIPTVHHETDPRLIVREDGQQFLYVGGKWYLPLTHKLLDKVWAEYAPLEAERQRRLETPMGAFIKERAQARFLYRRSWWEVGQSIGLDIGESNGVLIAHSRHNPIKARPVGYAQLRGGQRVLSYVIYNPLLGMKSRYITFDAADILKDATDKHRSNYQNALARKFRSLVPKPV